MPKSLKVLHVIPSLGPARGGPSFQLRLVAEHLVLRGIKVHVVTTDDNGKGRLQLDDWEFEKMGVLYRFFPRTLYPYTVSVSLARWLRQHIAGYDAVHIHALFSFTSIVASSVARRQGVPYVLRPIGTLSAWSLRNRHPLLKRLSMLLFERRALRGSASVHFASSQERREAALAVDVANPIVIPNAVLIPTDSDRPNEIIYETYPSLRDRFVVLFMSRLDSKKGLDVLLDGFGEFWSRHPEAALVIAGEGPERLSLELHRQADELGIGGEITWTGMIRDEVKAGMLSVADVFVLLSHSENFGNALAEAMAAGVPVVTTKAVGIWREIEEAGAGRVIDHSSVDCSATLAELAENEKARHLMAIRGRRLAAEMFSPELVAEKLVKLYEGLTPESRT